MIGSPACVATQYNFWCSREQRLTWVMSVTSDMEWLHFTSEDSASTLRQSQPHSIIPGTDVLDNLYHLLFCTKAAIR